MSMGKQAQRSYVSPRSHPASGGTALELYAPGYMAVDAHSPASFLQHILQVGSWRCPWQIAPVLSPSQEQSPGAGNPRPAHTRPYLMMSMWPFLAARCKGLVPLGSVVSPGRGSSKAVHMLLLRSSWTTLKKGSE